MSQQFETTFRQLLKVPNIDIGLGAYNWHVYEDRIEFRCIRFGSRFSFGLDTVLSAWEHEDNTSVYGVQVDGRKDGMTIAIHRAVTQADLNMV